MAGSERRRHRGHPWWFMLAFGTSVTALLAGDGWVALATFLFAVALTVY